MTDAEPLKIGIVGLGNIAHHHAERILNLGGRVVAGADIKDEARVRFAETYGATTYGSYADMYADEELDGVIVTTPNKFHEECTVGALEAGLNVLLEKPLAHTLESAERIAEVARGAEGFCMLGFNNRFANGIEVLKAYQEEGRLGNTAHVEANYVRRRGIPGRGTWFTSKEVAGGGALIDIGVHAIDLSLYLLDFPEVVEVSGVVRSQFGSREDYAWLDMWGEDRGPDAFDVGDSTSAFIRCADGRSINLEVAWATNRPEAKDFLVRGTEAGAKFDMDDGSLHFYESSRTGANHFCDTKIETQLNDTHTSELETFFGCIHAGDAPARNTVAQALVVQRVIDAIYRSDAESRAIRLDEPVEEVEEREETAESNESLA